MKKHYNKSYYECFGAIVVFGLSEKTSPVLPIHNYIECISPLNSPTYHLSKIPSLTKVSNLKPQKRF